METRTTRASAFLISRTRPGDYQFAKSKPEPVILSAAKELGAGQSERMSSFVVLRMTGYGLHLQSWYRAWRGGVLLLIIDWLAARRRTWLP